MALDIQPFILYGVMALMMLGAFIIGFVFGKMSPKKKAVSKLVAKEVEEMAAKVLKVEQQLELVQQRVEIADIENSQKVRVIKEDAIPSNASRFVEKSAEIFKNKTAKRTEKTTKDNLQEITGIGPYLEERLNDLGYFSFEQIMLLSDQEATTITEELGLFSGRIHRDNWMGQAKALLESQHVSNDS